MAAVGTAALAWPFIDQMNPDASTRALASIDVDISLIEPGQAITVKWRGKPVFIRNRTDKEVEENPDNVASRIVRLAKKFRKPLVVSICVTSGADTAYNRFGHILDSGGVPSYLTADQAMICLNEFIRYRLLRASLAYDEWLK